MKLLFATTIFSALLFGASTVTAAPCSADSCVAGQAGFNGVRQYAALGTKNWSRRVLDKSPKGWFRTEWNKVMAGVVKNHSCAFEQHYPALASKVYWRDAYINSSIKPTRAQARDPNWSNYVWNRPENGDGFVYDGITDALNDSLVDNGRGIAKLAVIVSLTASSGNWVPPAWVQKDKSLAWVEKTDTNGNSGSWHVRFDKPAAVDHAADFLTAFLAKYGDNKGIHSITLGEYYTGNKHDRPSDLNRNKYWVGMKNLWGQIVKAAPLDENGQRINILQTNPVFSNDVTLSDLEALGIGMSESDTSIDFPVTRTPETAAMKQLYDGNKVHVMINGDARYACQGRRQGWDGTPNPFGHRKGYSGVATPQEVFWYHSDKGPVPSHSIFLAMAYSCKGAPQTPANFIDAIKKFGRCGSQATRWGVAPVALPESNDAGVIARGKPKSPPKIAVK